MTSTSRSKKGRKCCPLPRSNFKNKFPNDCNRGDFYSFRASSVYRKYQEHLHKISSRSRTAAVLEYEEKGKRKRERRMNKKELLRRYEHNVRGRRFMISRFRELGIRVPSEYIDERKLFLEPAGPGRWIPQRTSSNHPTPSGSKMGGSKSSRSQVSAMPEFRMRSMRVPEGKRSVSRSSALRRTRCSLKEFISRK